MVIWSVFAYLYGLFVRLLMNTEITQFETFCPVPLVEVHQHRLLKFGFPVVHRDRVVVSVQPVDESLYRGFVDVPDIRCRLPGLATRDNGMWIDKTEGINYDFPFNGLDRVNHDGD